MSEREKLKKRAESVAPEDWLKLEAATILALLSELEQAEKRLSAEDCHACAEETKQCVYHTGRDAGFSEGRMEANCDYGQWEQWMSDQLMEKVGIVGKDLQEAILKTAAALRTLRQASATLVLTPENVKRIDGGDPVTLNLRDYIPELNLHVMIGGVPEKWQGSPVEMLKFIQRDYHLTADDGHAPLDLKKKGN